MLNFVNGLRVASIIMVGAYLVAGVIHQLVDVIKNDINPTQMLFVWALIVVYFVTSVIVKVAEKKENI